VTQLQSPLFFQSTLYLAKSCPLKNRYNTD